MRQFLPGGLWRHPDFMKLWGAETVSQLGTHVSQLALPLVAIIVLEATAFEVALLTVIEMAPFILISLPAGVWVDRLRRKPILVAADVGRAVLLLSIPIAHWLEGNAKLEVSRSGTQLAGPGIAGALVQALTAPIAVLVDAISFLVSALSSARCSRAGARAASASARRSSSARAARSRCC